ncbi:hypothetical protein ACFVZW_35050 [Streptomyces sp. NPDC059567]|uniref:hypothetical protein n=1 Tax=Streptomyces sp. NPDC059567 TaxID=3346867 RepID=UPI003693C3C0
MLSVVTDDSSTQSGSLIDEIVREGACRITGAHLVSLARAGATVENGALVERQEKAA